MSMLPCSATTWSNTPWNCSSLVMSAGCTLTRLPKERNISAVCSSISFRRAVRAMFAPARASPRAKATPRPLEAPVTMAVLPWRLKRLQKSGSTAGLRQVMADDATRGCGARESFPEARHRALWVGSFVAHDLFDTRHRRFEPAVVVVDDVIVVGHVRDLFVDLGEAAVEGVDAFAPAADESL